MAEKKVIELEVKTDSVQSLKSQLKEAQAQVQILSEKFGATSQQATEAAEKAAELKDAIGDAAALTDAFNPDAKFNALAGSIGGVISGVQAYEGALGLMGVESEAVQQTMLKLQAAMALTQGLQGLGESIDTFKQLGAVIARTAAGQKILNALSIVFTGIQKALNVVMNANPIFLIITGITLAIGAFKLFTSETESAEEANEKLNNSIEKQNELFELNAAKIKKNAENRRRLLEANGASEEELHKDTLRRLKEEENLRVRQMSIIEKQNAQRRKIYKKAMDEENYDIAKDIQKKIQEDNKKYKELALNNQEYKISVKEENKRFNDEQAKEEKEKNDKAKQQAAEAAKAALEKRKEALAKIREAEKEFALYQLTDREQEIAKEQEKYNELINLAKKYNQDTANLELAKRNAINDINVKYDQAELEAKEKRDQEAYAKELEKRNKAEELRRQEIAEEEAYFEQYSQSLLTSQQSEIQAVTDKYFTLIEMAKQYGLSTSELEEKQRKELDEINKKYDEEEEARRQQRTDKIVQNVTQAMSVVSEFASQTQQKYDNLNKAILDNDKLTDKEKQRLLDENNKRAKKAFEVQKAVSIASALIATYQSAVSAYQSQFLPLPDPSSPIRGAIAAAIAVAAGLANVKNITAQKFEGASVASSTSSGGGGAGASAGSSGVVTPNFNIVGNAQATNPLAGLGGPIQAYVVSGDVTTAQSLDRRRVNYATFG